MEIIPTPVWAWRSLVFNWFSLAREDANLDFYTKTMAGHGVNLADSKKWGE